MCIYHVYHRFVKIGEYEWKLCYLEWPKVKLNGTDVRFAIVDENECKLRICKRLLNWMKQVLNPLTE